MALPELYSEGLKQHALRGPEHLSTYKLGVIEAILKEALRSGDDEADAAAVLAAARTALDVARWEMRPPRTGQFSGRQPSS